MAHTDAGHYGKKHPTDKKVNKIIADAIIKASSEGKITCAAAHKTAEVLSVSPNETGFTIDKTEIRISNCQLGLFGYAPEKRIVKATDDIMPEVEKAITNRLESGRLPCITAWEIAREFKIPKIKVSSVAEKIQIKINRCQLGAF